MMTIEDIKKERRIIMDKENLEMLIKVVISLNDIEVKGKNSKVFGSCIEVLENIYNKEKEKIQNIAKKD